MTPQELAVISLLSLGIPLISTAYLLDKIQTISVKGNKIIIGNETYAIPTGSTVNFEESTKTLTINGVDYVLGGGDGDGNMKYSDGIFTINGENSDDAQNDSNFNKLFRVMSGYNTTNNNINVGGIRENSGSENSIAIGTKGSVDQTKGIESQGLNSIAIGVEAGLNDQNENSISIGPFAGNDRQGFNSVAIGFESGRTRQGEGSVAVGSGAGNTDQGVTAVAVGYDAGNSGQGEGSVAVGGGAGNSGQGTNSVAVGSAAGNSGQGTNSVAVGYIAGNDTQGTNSVAVGSEAGRVGQGEGSVAVGYNAGNSGQGTNSVAVGSEAGVSNLGSHSVVVGKNSKSNNKTSTIIIGSSTSASNNGDIIIGHSTYVDNDPAVGKIKLGNKATLVGTSEFGINVPTAPTLGQINPNFSMRFTINGENYLLPLFKE